MKLKERTIKYVSLDLDTSELEAPSIEEFLKLIYDKYYELFQSNLLIDFNSDVKIEGVKLFSTSRFEDETELTLEIKYSRTETKEEMKERIKREKFIKKIQSHQMLFVKKFNSPFVKVVFKNLKRKLK